MKPARLIALCTVLLVGATARAQPVRGAAEPAEESTAAIDGGPIVIPMRSATDAEEVWTPERAPVVTTVDGRTLQTRFVFVARTPPPAPGAATCEDHGADHEVHVSTRGWMGPAPEFEIIEHAPTDALYRAIDEAGARGAGGGWSLVIRAPVGQRFDALMIDGRRHDLRVLPREAYAARRELIDRSDADWSRLGAFVAPLLADPDERWRVRLLEDRLGPSTLWPDGRPEGLERGGVLDAIADQTEQRWRAALGVIHAHDAQAAIDLVRTLTSVVRLPSGIVAPAWPAERRDDRQLLEAILAPGLKPEDAVRRARSYIDSLPAACLTVLDDNEGVLAITEVRGQTLDVSVAGRRVRLAPFQTDLSVIPESPGAGGVSVAEVTAGPLRSQAAAINGAAPVSPPGFRVGPFFEPWTLIEWRSATPMPAMGRHACAALVQRAPVGAGRDVGGGRWQVYVECAASHSGVTPGDEVVMYFGPSRANRIERRVDGGGTIRDQKGEEVGSFPTMFDHGIWWAIVPIPPEAIEADGTVLIAMERRDATGWRATWPRALLPGDERPAPVRLDLRAWDAGAARD